jgi:hypothetical protein
MSPILDHLDQVSMFGRSLIGFVVMLGLDWIFLALHAYEEWRGDGVPLEKLILAFDDSAEAPG